MSIPRLSPDAGLEEELRDYCDQLRNIKEDADELTATLTNEQFNWRAGAGKWSIAECVAHLNAVDGLDVPAIEREIRTAKEQGIFGKGPFRYGWLSRTVVRSMEPPVRRLRFSTPKVYQPLSNQPKDKIVPEFMALHDRLIELMRSANGLDLARVKVGSPVGTWLKFSLGQRFALITTHDRRHLWQAWEVRKNRDFPTS
jgi:hypothetical protein